jgi:hypothetical protein
MPNTLRKPTAMLEAAGSFEKHPGRRRTREPNSGRGIGPAPAHLDEGQRAIWDEVVSSCAPGVFQSSDRGMMEMLCVLFAEFRADYVGFGGRKYQTLFTLLARCGMTPADRSRVTVERNEPEEKPKTGLASFR